MDPTLRDAWSTSLELLFRLRDDGRATSLCDEAAARFPDFKIRPELAAHIDQARRAATIPVNDTLGQARLALEKGEDDRVITLSETILAEQPDHFDALALLAFALRRQGQLEPALERYQKLRTLQPENDVWKKWVRHLEERLSPFSSGSFPALGLAHLVFVALNEKKKIVSSLRDYVEKARQWE